MMHPWHLSKTEMQALAAIVERGTSEKAASEIGVDHKLLNESLRRARKKMGVNSTLLAAVAWDRWSRLQITVQESNQALLCQIRELVASEKHATPRQD